MSKLIQQLQQLVTPQQPATFVAPDSLVLRARVIAPEGQLPTRPSTAWTYETTGKLPLWPKPYKIGTHVYYKRSEIDAFIASLVATPRGKDTPAAKAMMARAVERAANRVMAKPTKVKRTAESRAT